MAVEAEEFYNNLNQLLADICKFLHDESNYKKLSGESRRQADALISRSKQQLQEIAKIQLNDSDEAYVLMDKPPPIVPDDDTNTIYSEPSSPANNNTINKIFTKGPYDDLPAKLMNRDIKCGILILKSKTIFGFEKKRRLFGGIHFERFILYLSEKDSKPFQVLDLEFCKAEAVEKCTKPSMDFIVKTNDAQKTFYFTALSHKDMLQWVVFVNEHLRRKLMDKNKAFEENYDCVNVVELQNELEIIPTNAGIEEDNDGEAVYNFITEPPNNENVPIPYNNPPKLPDRRPGQRRFVPLPEIPTERPISEQSVASYAPIDDTNTEAEDSVDEDSFSEGGDESDYYEEFVPRPTDISEILGTKTDSPPPDTPTSVKPTPPALKPKPPVLFAKPSMLHRSGFNSSFKKND